MNLQKLKQALIAYTSNTAKAIWSALSYPAVIPSTKDCNVKDYRIWGAEGGVGNLNESGEYVIPVVVRGKNYFDLDKVPFNSSTTKPYNNGMIATRVNNNIYTNRVPLDVPVGKKINISFDVVDFTINGETTNFRIGFYGEDGDTLYNPAVAVSKAHKTFSFTPKEKVANMRFYFTGNASTAGDSVTVDNIMLRTEGEDVWEAYIKPQTIEVISPVLLTEGTNIQKSIDGLPNLPQFKGTTIYETTTTVAPSGIEVQYYE